MLEWLRSLSPVASGPWWSARKRVLDIMLNSGVRPGDIICRLGNAVVYGVFPFSDFMTYVTQSKYSHAALVLDVTANDILLADVNQTGLRRQFVMDWCDDIRGNDIIILRYIGPDSERVIPGAVNFANTIVYTDPAYDEGFFDNDNGRNLYCVELIYWSYLSAGVLLSPDVPINQLPGWSSWMYLITRTHGIDPYKPVWCVGNHSIGLLSSRHLGEVCRIPKPVNVEKLKRNPSDALWVHGKSVAYVH